MGNATKWAVYALPFILTVCGLVIGSLAICVAGIWIGFKTKKARLEYEMRYNGHEKDFAVGHAALGKQTTPTACHASGLPVAWVAFVRRSTLG
jgi:hypothetical protein